ncbi:ferredoxin--NADP reductase [Flavobacteriaceae bacterium S356]|uniref:Ferredoxin--NADP reductase n=1 Tax=Asprobacillus argus TaxID=3076534 RepID=A0ABU3LBQ0_9FLAO|nr:ferredoxin--NADP reductase [Flavobacteriaceae bacterium S356]
MSTFHTLTVQDIIKETADAVSIVFSIPEHLKNDFSFDAGQYVTLKKEINGTEIRRAYSICSSPKSGFLKVAVKAVENGTFSTYATTKLQAGDTLDVHTPEGKFVLSSEANKNYIGFAAGSGITPVMSMVKEVLEKGVNASFTLIYGNKTEADTIFKNELDVLQHDFPNNFNLHYVYSRERIDGSKNGRIDESIANYYVKNLYKDISFESAFLCGPEEMIHSVSDILKSCGFDNDAILFELFTASVEEENTAQITEGNSEITVFLDDEETTFTMQQTDTILAASLRNDLDAPYSCQGGVCSSCLGKVTKGKAVMTKNSILTDSEVADGYVLACQAHPTTPKISIDFDDV